MSGSARSPRELRAVVIHGGVVIVIALVLLLIGLPLSGGARTGVLVASESVVIVGALSALVRTYLVYRAGGRWQIWQGGSWFLLATFLVWTFTIGPAIMGVQ
ncbi:MAG: hypothetical protein QM658_01115 [Gordonia sp. (in: high G+C Gram-positive bacteria)]